MSKKISIVTPTFNEEQNIEKLCLEISKEISKTNYDYEHIVIDNSSTDNTIKILKELSKKSKNLKVIINKKNFGHIRSPMHGMFQASGDVVILMMSDFQDPIELITQYIKEWENGSKVVMGQKDSSDENFLIHHIKNIGYKFINKISDDPLLINTTGSGLYDKSIIDIIKKIDDPYPYFRGLISEITNETKLIKYHQPKRAKGETKNNFYTLCDIGILGIVKHSKIPLRLATIFGLLFSFFSILTAIIFFIYKLIYWDSFDLGVAPIIIGLFALGSVQIFILGFIGEYVMNILTQTRKLPLVIEKERINF
jgi:glycosyltransferase involved in cell wall biosynthesis